MFRNVDTASRRVVRAPLLRSMPRMIDLVGKMPVPRFILTLHHLRLLLCACKVSRRRAPRLVCGRVLFLSAPHLRIRSVPPRPTLPL